MTHTNKDVKNIKKIIEKNERNNRIKTNYQIKCCITS